MMETEGQRHAAVRAGMDEWKAAVAENADRWVPANGGTETWTRSRSGASFLYVFNPATGATGWLDETDIVHESDPYGLV